MTTSKPYFDDENIEPWEMESENFVQEADSGEKSEFVSKGRSNANQRQRICSGMPLYMTMFTFVFALVAFMAFDQGIITVPDSAELATAAPAAAVSAGKSANPIGSKPWDMRYNAVAEFQAKKDLAWEIALEEADRMLSNGDYKTASCLMPDTAKTATLVKDAQTKKYKKSSNTATKRSSDVALLPLPLLNLGMPKCGTTSALAFFRCAGYKSTHSATGDFCPGLCMRDAANTRLPVLESCANGVDAMLEMDCSGSFGTEYKMGAYHSPKLRDDCFYPQLSLLEELHEEDPNATFLLEFRPVDDWIESFLHWMGAKITEIQKCNLPNLPRGIPDVQDSKDVHDQSVRFMCSTVIHARNFVRDHPSHALVEIDLYDSDTNGDVLGTLFPHTNDNSKSDDCWGHVSHGKDLHEGDTTAAAVREQSKGGQGNGQQKGGQGNGQQKQQNGGNGNRQ
jgi:hypothetical protein